MHHSVKRMARSQLVSRQSIQPLFMAAAPTPEIGDTIAVIQSLSEYD
jgi:hypothetical protein